MREAIGPGIDRVDADSFAGPLRRGAARQADDGVLAGIVCADARGAGEVGDARTVDDAAAAGRVHGWADVLEAEKHADNVDVDDPPEVGERVVGNRPHRPSMPALLKKISMRPARSAQKQRSGGPHPRRRHLLHRLSDRGSAPPRPIAAAMPHRGRPPRCALRAPPSGGWSPRRSRRRHRRPVLLCRRGNCYPARACRGAADSANVGRFSVSSAVQSSSRP